MSYLADIIKSEFRKQLQYESDLNRANQILETVPTKQEESKAKIAKAVTAAEALEETDTLAQELYDTYPDVDVTQYGLPEPQHKRVKPVVDSTPEPSTAVVPYDSELQIGHVSTARTPIPMEEVENTDDEPQE